MLEQTTQRLLGRVSALANNIQPQVEVLEPQPTEEELDELIGKRLDTLVAAAEEARDSFHTELKAAAKAAAEARGETVDEEEDNEALAGAKKAAAKRRRTR